MPVLGINTKSIEIKKEVTSVPSGQIEVKISPRITDMRLGEIRTPTGKTNAIEVIFRYEVEYNPKIAQSVIEGSVLYLPPNKEKIDEILNLWEDEKRIDPLTFAEVINFITNELSPILMILAKEMRLPYHLPVPRVELKRE